MKKGIVDRIIYNAIILTINPRNEVIKNGSLAIKDRKIIALGPNKEIESAYDAAETLDATDQIAMPGLVDTHFHTGQQFERNLMTYLKKETHLRDPIWQYALIPFEASLSDEDIYLSAKLAYSNMLKVGTTCFADPGGPRPENMAPAMQEIGIRGILARSTLDTTSDIPVEMQDTVEGVVAKGEHFYKEWYGKANGRIRTWMALREIMVSTTGLIKAVKETADRLGVGIHTHLGEHPSEVDFAIMKSGMRPAHYLESLGFLGRNVHAAHSALLSQSELDLYEKYDVSVAHCPAVAFAFCGPTKVPEMLRRGIRVGIGTDGAFSSGGSLDLFKQMAITRYAQTAIFGLPYREDLSFVNDASLLRLATIGGAQALQWDDEIGSLEPGKIADVLLINLNALELLPMYDPINVAASIASGASVDTVLVNGDVVMRHRKLRYVDEEALIAKVKERTPKILKHFLERVGSK